MTQKLPPNRAEILDTSRHISKHVLGVTQTSSLPVKQMNEHMVGTTRQRAS